MYAPNDYLYVLSLRGATIPEKEAEGILFGMLKDIAYDERVDCSFRDLKNVNVVSSIDCKEIYRAVSDLKKLNCPDTLEKFWEFDSEVARTYDAYMVYDRYFDENFEDSSWGLEKVLRSSIKSCFEHACLERTYEGYDNLKPVMPRLEYYSIPTTEKLESQEKVSTITQENDSCNETIWKRLKESNPALENLGNAFELTPLSNYSNANTDCTDETDVPF